MLFGGSEAGSFREVAAVHSDHLRQVPLQTHHSLNHVRSSNNMVCGMSLSTLHDQVCLHPWNVPTYVVYEVCKCMCEKVIVSVYLHVCHCEGVLQYRVYD